MLKKIVAGTVLIGLVGVLTVGAITRTVDKQEQVAGVSALGRGQGGGERSGDTQTGQGQAQGRGQGQGQGQGRGQTASQGAGSAAVGQGRGEGAGSGQTNPSGAGRGSGSGERQYPNMAEAPQDWVTTEGTVVQAPQEGVDLIIETHEGTQLQVGTGPNYLESQGFALQAGEKVQVEGYWEDGELKAAELTRLQDGASITLRDAAGHPAWAGSGRRAQANAEAGTAH